MKQSVKDIEHQNEEYENVGTSLAKIMTVFSAVVVVGFVAVTTVSNSMVSRTTSDMMSIEYAKLDESRKMSLFEKFATTYQRNYLTDGEKTEKFANFQKFLHAVDKRNSEEKFKSSNMVGRNIKRAFHGITRFADFTTDEFKTFLGYIRNPVPKKDDKFMKIGKIQRGQTNVTVRDWRGVLANENIYDQGFCGACWAFSSVGQIEADSVRSGLLSVGDTLSPQQVVTCDDSNYGCKGGNPELAYAYIRQTGGVTTSDSYPFTSYLGTTPNECKSNLYEKKISVESYTKLQNEEDMIEYVLSTGPLSVCIDSSEWNTYVSGIVTSCGKNSDHCVQIVGVNLEEGYWTIRNSWGTHWGEGGYIRLATGENMCNIVYNPTFTAPVEV